MLGTEQPNENQSSFGPSNQSSTFSDPNQNQNQGQASPNTSGWATTNQQQPTQSGALPWQNNNTQPSFSNPSWNVGHDGTQNGMNREQWRDSWMGSGTSNNQMMDQWLAQNGGQRLNDAGVVRTPYGEILDMGIAYKTGQGKPGFTDIGMNQAGQSPIFAPSQNALDGTYPGGSNQQQMNPQILQILQQLVGQNQQTTPQLNQTSSYNFGGSNPNQTMDISSLTGPSFQPGMMDYRPGHTKGQIENYTGGIR